MSDRILSSPEPADKTEKNGEALPDPFDPERLRLSQDFAEDLGVKKALLQVPVRKPDKAWWVRVHPDSTYHLTTGCIELKDDNQIYLVDPPLWERLATESTFTRRALYTAINRQGVLFLWQIRLPGPDGRQDEWSRTAIEAASMAQRQWIRATANISLGGYEVHQASGDIPEPIWPDHPFGELLKVAFKDRYINTWDHAVLQQLRGEK